MKSDVVGQSLEFHSDCMKGESEGGEFIGCELAWLTVLYMMV